MSAPTVDFADRKEEVRRQNPIEEVVSRYISLTRRGRLFVGLCPFHPEANPSFTIYPSDGHCHCFSCGFHGDVFSFMMKIEQEDFPAALERLGAGVISTRIIRATPTPPTTPPVAPPVVPSDSDEDVLTLEQLVEAKELPGAFLRDLGCTTTSYKGNPAVLMPYRDEQGKVVEVRYRIRLDGSGRFKWRFGDHVMLYGLDRLVDIRQQGWVLLVEGESDCWTAWLNDLPALGIPGKSTWKSEWAALLRGLTVYLWVEPDAEDLVQRVAADIPGLRIIHAPASKGGQP